MNGDNVKSEPIIKDDKSSNADDINQHGISMNVSKERIANCASFNMRKSIAERFGIVKKFSH